MKPLLSLLTLAALGAFAGPVWAAAAPMVAPLVGLLADQPAPADALVWRVDSDDDDEGKGWRWFGGEDDDDEGCGDDDDEDEGGENCAKGAANPAPSGSVAPPKNGLFGNGAAPKAVTN